MLENFLELSGNKTISIENVLKINDKVFSSLEGSSSERFDDCVSAISKVSILQITLFCKLRGRNYEWKRCHNGRITIPCFILYPTYYHSQIYTHIRYICNILCRRFIDVEIFFTQIECTMYLFLIISRMENIIENLFINWRLCIIK